MTNFVNENWPFLLVIVAPCAVCSAFALGATIGAWLANRGHQAEIDEAFLCGKRNGYVTGFNRGDTAGLVRAGQVRALGQEYTEAQAVHEVNKILNKPINNRTNER